MATRDIHQKAFVRYDRDNRVIPGSLIVQKNKPAMGNWEEIDLYKRAPSVITTTTTTSGVPTTTTTTTVALLPLTLVFDDILNAESLIGGSASSLDLWNGFFVYGSTSNLYYPFTSVVVDVNTVHLYGIGEKTVNWSNSTFNNQTCIISIDDPSGLIISTPGIPFRNATNLTLINLPNLLYTNGNNFAYGCTSLVTINLPSFIFNESTSFYGCTSLQNVTLSSFLNNNGNNMFQNCSSLVSLDLPEMVQTYSGLVDSCSLIETVYMPKCKYIGSWTFYNCTSITYIDMSSCVNLGGSVGNDDVFTGITGNTITIKIPHALEADGDIIWLKANNTVTVLYSD